MTTLIAALFVLSATTVCAENSIEDPQTSAYETTLNTAANYLDRVFVNALTSLQLVALTPEARAGNWNAIRRYLLRLEPGLPGVYFYVLPDGNYYSTTKGYTNLNLSDRSYFRSLFAGHSVKGFPIYSRSTGQRSALIAAPILVNGRVVGALGTSVFLDTLASKMSKMLDLPPEYMWFVVSATGTIMLSGDHEFIFMDSLTQGSPSLRDAVSAAVQRDSGVARYSLGTVRHARYKKLPGMDWWMFLSKTEGAGTPAEPQLKVSLDRFVPDLQASLSGIDRSLTKLMAQTKLDVHKESSVRHLLDALLDANIYIVEAAYVDPKGILRYIEPGEYKNFENQDISQQPHVIAMRDHPAPMLSGGFVAVEDFLAVVDSHPVYDEDAHYAGSIHLLIRPELMIDALLQKTTIPENNELLIMQTDGMIIYDDDKKEIGKMLFSDPLYAGYDELRQLGRKIAAAPAGEGSYVFLSPQLGKNVFKTAVWRTVTLNGREWRVVLAHRPYEKTP